MILSSVRLRRKPSPGRKDLICYIITDHISSIFISSQLEYLAEKGWEVWAACNPPAEDESPFSDKVRFRGVQMKRQPAPISDFIALVDLIRFLRALRPSVVNYSTPKAALLGALAARLAGVPVRVYVVRGFRFEGHSGLPRRLLIGVERIIASLSTTVLFNSPSLKTQALAQGIGDTASLVLRNALDTSRLEPPIPNADARSALGLRPDGLVLLFVGRLVADKGVGDLVRLTKRLKSDGISVRLLLVGPREERDGLDQETVDAISTSRDVVYLGPMDDVRIAYYAADLLVFPSRREGLPGVPLEAGYCGLPTVAYSATGTVDAVVDGVTGILVSVGDEPSLLRSVKRYLADGELRRMHGVAARRLVAGHYNPSTVHKELLDVYLSEIDTKWR